jgi:transcriptional regulator of arginine metabolism
MRIRHRPAGRAGRAQVESRRALLRRLLAERPVTSQDEVLRLLRQHGHAVTQATASRDLAAIGAEKDARERYRVAGALPANGAGGDDARAELLREFVLAVDHSANLAVLRTTPGSAATVASALDRAPLDGMLATLAGDDTVLVVARSPRGGAPLRSRFERILEGEQR